MLINRGNGCQISSTQLVAHLCGVCGVCVCVVCVVYMCVMCGVCGVYGVCGVCGVVRVSGRLSCSVLDPQVLTGVVYKIYYIDHLVEGFMKGFNRYYADALATDFNSLPLAEQADYVKLLYRVQWTAFLLPLYLSLPSSLLPPIPSASSLPSSPLPPHRKCWDAGRCPSTMIPMSCSSLGC